MSLPEQERDAFREELAVRDSSQVVKVYDILAQQGGNDTDILRKCKVTYLEKFRLVQRLYQRLLEFTSQGSPEQTLRRSLALARRLVQNLRWDTAEAVIRSSLELSHQVDDLGIFLDFHELADCFPEERRLDLDLGLFQDIALQAEDLAVFRRLLLGAEREKRMPNDDGRRQRLERIQREAEGRAAGRNLAPKARFLYWRTVSLTHVLSLDFVSLVSSQRALLAHLEAFPFVAVDVEYLSALETARLARALWVVRDREGFHAVCKELMEREFKSKLAETERTYWRFPFMVGVATVIGDREFGVDECARLLEMLDMSKEKKFKQGFKVQCLYVCALFYHAASDHTMLSRMLGKIHQLGKHDREPRYFHMARFLQVVQEIEQGNWVEAAEMLRNLRNSKVPMGLEGLEHATAFLREWIRHKPFSAKKETFPLVPKLEELRLAMEGKLVFDYFDLPAWVEAQRRRLPLLAIYHDRANGPNPD